MSGFIPGQGFKKPLNMLEAPIYPDIKQNPIQFKNSGKFWQVDTAQVMLDTEMDTQIYGDAVFAKSYRDNIDKYGQSSHQEKITVFRPPLQNSYEDFGPLNRLPTKIYAIHPHINPSTVSDGNGSSAFKVNNTAIQGIENYITDRVNTDSWFSTYYSPIDGPEDLQGGPQPDLITTLPSYSVSSGHASNLTKDAPNPRSLYMSTVHKPQAECSNHAGFSTLDVYHQTLQQQSPGVSYIDLYRNQPYISMHSGYNDPTGGVNGETQVDSLVLERNNPIHSISSGYSSNININGSSGVEDIQLYKKSPLGSVSSGVSMPHMINGETRLDELEFKSHLTSKLQVSNPGSETGFQTRIESYTSPEEYIKLRENPKVSNTATQTFSYKSNENIQHNKIDVRRKIEPLKGYSSGLNGGTILKSGVQQQPVNTRLLRGKIQSVY